MDPCDIYEDWEDIDQFHALESAIEAALEEWGFDGVDYVNGPGPEGGRPAGYDDGTIYLDMGDPDYADAWEDPQDALAHAYHEAMHAMLDQAGLSTQDFEEELEAGFLGSRAADEALDGCECSEPVGSSDGDDVPPFPWRCDLDSGF